MRKTGKTTRTIDKAIQLLFENKKIIVPITSYMDADLRGWHRNDVDKIIVDPDFHENPKSVHRDLLARILRRVYFEHTDAYHHTIVKQQGKFTFIEIK